MALKPATSTLFRRVFVHPTSSFVPASRAQFSSTARHGVDFTHAVVGAGVVGLAVARELQKRDGASTVVIERHGTVGTETSSRNSEVIHAGLYYGKDTLKTRLCLQGKRRLYELCAKHDIPHRNAGKWIVAQDDTQFEALEKMHEFASSVGVPTHFLSKQDAERREPDVRAEAGVLESPTTGIVDSHAFMQYLEGDFLNDGGVCAFNSPVINVTPLDAGRSGWEITTRSRSRSGDIEESTITASTLVNCAGLAAIPLSNSMLPAARHRKPYYAKGSYYAYTAPSPKASTLIYPAPIPGHAGLGTHLTLDLSGRIRFGPDVEWLEEDSSTSSAFDPSHPSAGAFPTAKDYTPSTANLAAAIDDIKTYFPTLDASAVTPDYVGIRAKLGRSGALNSGSEFKDFLIERVEGFEGWVDLLGVESPGLTGSLAIGEFVGGLVYGESKEGDSG